MPNHYRNRPDRRPLPIAVPFLASPIVHYVVTNNLDGTWTFEFDQPVTIPSPAEATTRGLFVCWLPAVGYHGIAVSLNIDGPTTVTVNFGAATVGEPDEFMAYIQEDQTRIFGTVSNARVTATPFMMDP